MRPQLGGELELEYFLIVNTGRKKKEKGLTEPLLRPYKSMKRASQGRKVVLSRTTDGSEWRSATVNSSSRWSSVVSHRFCVRGITICIGAQKTINDNTAETWDFERDYCLWKAYLDPTHRIDDRRSEELTTIRLHPKVSNRATLLYPTGSHSHLKL